METEAPPQARQRFTFGPVLWGAVTALAAAAAVTLIAAGWITLRGYPDHAQFLSAPLADINAIAGEVEETDTGVRLIPDNRGVAIVLLDAAPRFPAVQFSKLTLEVVNVATLRGGQALWATRDAPEETHRVPLELDGLTLSANLAESPNWIDRVNGIGVALMAQGPVELDSVTLRPPEPSFTYVLIRMWKEWSYREGYHGHTINSLKGARPAALVPIGLAGGFTLLIAGAAWLLVTRRTHRTDLRRPGLFAVIATLWFLLSLPWVRETWAEAIWSVQTYADKTEAERRLSEPDAHIYALAQEVKAQLPKEPQRIWVLAREITIQKYERWKLKYFLAPHSMTLALNRHVTPARGWLRPGDYIVIAGAEPVPSTDKITTIQHGYRADVLGFIDGYGIFRIRSDQD